MSAEQAVRLYTLKQEVLCIHPGEPSLQVDRILLDESSRERFLLVDPGASFTRERLPVHVVALRIGELSERPFTPGPRKNCEELHYFAVEPALRHILEAPFRDELRVAKRDRDRMEKAMEEAKEELCANEADLEETMELIELLNSAPLYRRLWIALRPSKFWEKLRRLQRRSAS